MLDARGHFLDSLTAQLMALQLAASCDDGFEEAAFRRIFEAEVQAVRHGVVFRERSAQRPVKLGVAREALEIIEDHDVALATIGAQVFERGHHARALHEVAACGLRIAKNFFDRHAECGRVLTATMLLTELAAAFDFLPDAGDAAVDDRRVYLPLIHDSSVTGGIANATLACLAIV